LLPPLAVAANKQAIISVLSCSFLHSPVTLPLLGPNILLSTPFSNTLSLLSSVVSDQVSHPYKTTGKIAVLYIQVRGTCLCFVTMPVFTVRSCQHLAQPPSWRTTPCRLSANSVHSQLHAILEAVLHAHPDDSPCRGDGPTYHGIHPYFVLVCPFVCLTLTSLVF
jgi:hypothetical protein